MHNTVDVLIAEEANGRRIAALISHAAHPVIIHGASTMISSDYPGFAVSAMREQLGKEGVLMFAQGCGANINGFPLQGGIAAAVSALKAVRKKGHAIKCDKLTNACLELVLPLQEPPAVEECRKLLARDPQSECRRELLEMALKKKKRTMRFPMQAFACGHELCILGLPHEMFAEYQLFVEEISPFDHNMVFAYTNGCEDYLGTKKDYQLGDRGGYETAPFEAPLLYHGRLAPQPSVETQIRKGIAKLLGNLNAAL